MNQRLPSTRTNPLHAALFESLDWLCGPLATRRVVAEALFEANLRRLPQGRDALFAFVRQRVLRLVHEALGPREAADFLTHFFAELEGLPVAGPEGAPASGLRRAAQPVPEGWAARTRVLLVTSDPLERAWLVGALGRAEFDVVPVGRFVDLAAAAAPLPAVALVDMATTDVYLLLAGLARRQPDVRVVAMGHGDSDALLEAEAILLLAGVHRYEVQGEEAGDARLVSALHRQAAD